MVCLQNFRVNVDFFILAEQLALASFVYQQQAITTKRSVTSIKFRPPETKIARIICLKLNKNNIYVYSLIILFQIIIIIIQRLLRENPVCFYFLPFDLHKLNLCGFRLRYKLNCSLSKRCPCCAKLAPTIYRLNDFSLLFPFLVNFIFVGKFNKSRRQNRLNKQNSIKKLFLFIILMNNI